MTDANAAKLVCGVYDSNAVFSIGIRSDATVTSLHAAIAAAMRGHEWPTVDAQALALYVAQKDGVWLKRDNHVTTASMANDVGTLYDELLTDDALAACVTQQQRDGDRSAVHVLIKLPATDRKALKRPRCAHEQEDDDATATTTTTQDGEGQLGATTMQIECAVYGEELTVIPVDIARSAKVRVLQEAIVAKKQDVNRRFRVDPSAIKLYVARKDGVWLTGDDTVDALLAGPVDTAYPKMSPWRKLNRYFVDGVDVEDDAIHVLVELPEVENAPPAKRLRVDGNKDMKALWRRMEWKLEEFPRADECPDLLLKPLPFRLKLGDAEVAHQIFQRDAKLVDCLPLVDLIQASLRLYVSPPGPMATVGSWFCVYGAFTSISTSMLRTANVAVHEARSCDELMDMA